MEVTSNIKTSTASDPLDSIELVFPESGAKLNLNDQRPRVARLLRSTIVKVQLDIVFKNVFPQQPLRQIIVPNALIEIARGLNDTELLARVCNDRDYRHALATIVSHQSCIIRKGTS